MRRSAHGRTLHQVEWGELNLCFHLLIVKYYFLIVHFLFRSFYKHVLGLSVDFQDLTVTEPDYAKTLQQILSNPLDLLMVELTFSAEIQRFGRTEVVDLIPDGSQIAVTGAAH